jgi:hypothetical protein
MRFTNLIAFRIGRCRSDLVAVFLSFAIRHQLASVDWGFGGLCA